STSRAELISATAVMLAQMPWVSLLRPHRRRYLLCAHCLKCLHQADTAKTKKASRRRPLALHTDTIVGAGLDAVVQVVFQRVHEGAHLEFFSGFQLDEGIEEVIAEHATLEQEVAVGVEGFQGFLQAAAHLRNQLGLF